jgi:hypothetical protein
VTDAGNVRALTDVDDAHLPRRPEGRLVHDGVEAVLMNHEGGSGRHRQSFTPASTAATHRTWTLRVIDNAQADRAPSAAGR